MNFQPKSISLILFAILICIGTSIPWINWNNATFYNITPFPTPLAGGISYTVSRYNPGNATFAASRKAQYQWQVRSNDGLTVCNVYCAPKSYLTVDPSNANNVVCKRDMSLNYWGGITNGGNPYNTYCIPNTDQTCTSFTGTGTPLKSLPIGTCDGNFLSGDY